MISRQRRLFHAGLFCRLLIVFSALVWVSQIQQRSTELTAFPAPSFVPQPGCLKGIGRRCDARSDDDDLAVHRRSLFAASVAGCVSLGSSQGAQADFSIFPQGSVFEGTYSVPDKLGSRAVVVVRAGVAVVRGTDASGKPWECRSTRLQGAPVILRLAGVQRQMWIDFSPIGGPKELRAVYEGNLLDNDNGISGDQGLKWDDGTRWTKLSNDVN